MLFNHHIVGTVIRPRHGLQLHAAIRTIHAPPGLQRVVTGPLLAAPGTDCLGVLTRAHINLNSRSPPPPDHTALSADKRLNLVNPIE